MLPGTVCKTVIGGKAVGKNAHIGCALDVVVAAEYVGSSAGFAHIAQHQLQDAEGAGNG